MIGIFWVYDGVVFGTACDRASGDENVPGIIDSPATHTDFWDTDKEYRRLFPELCFKEYIEVPRGRVLYSTAENKTIVYMDKTLFSDATKKLIQKFFHLHNQPISWRTDLHYTTASKELDNLLDCEWDFS